MKKLVSILFFLILGIATNAQTAQFAWMAGSTYSNQIGAFGTKGVSSSTNMPSSRNEAYSWSDNSNNFWMFGGNGHSPLGNLGALNDLWKYSVATNEWVWISGGNTINLGGNYGTKSIPSATNNPGGRYAGVTWNDNNGNLWVFGGYGHGSTVSAGYLNDLWKYNIATNEWTWISGSNLISQQGTYGTLGVSSASNTPGARAHSVTWVDNSGNLWMHGGQGLGTSATVGYLSDLWKFDVVTSQWTWVSGTNVISSSGVYGTKGTPAAGNRPGGRGSAVSWTDNSGNLWLFGGNGHATAATMAKLNDLWKFDIGTSQWTWISGFNGLGFAPVYGVKGAPAISNMIGARDQMVSWKDNSGNFWILGGHGKDITNGFDNELNDLWFYNLTTNVWTYVAGSTNALQSGIYGTQGVLSSTNVIGSRQKSVSFIDINNDLWLFSGYGKPSAGAGYLNDLWKIKTCYTSLASNTTSSLNLVVCSNQSTTLSATGVGALGWYSAVSGGTYLGSGNNYSTPTITANTTYYVQDSTCGAGPRVAITVSVNALPSLTVTGTNSLCIGNTGTISVSGASSYTWNTTATTTSIAVTPTVTTTYTVIGTNVNGCVSSKTKTVTVSALPSLSVTGSDITICKGTASIISVTGANSYTWNTGSTNSSFIASPTVTTIYTVTGRNSTTGCVNVKTTTLTVQSPTVTIAGTFALCQNSSSTYTASGANTYSWTSSGIAPVYTNTAVLYPNGTVYTLVGKDALGCTMSQTFVITALTNPSVSIGLPFQGCPGQTVTMTASGASTYTWMPGNIVGSTAAVSPSVNTTYTLYGTAANTCTNSTTSILTIKTPPSISITASNLAVCSGANVSLFANGSTSNTYTWSTGVTTNSTVVTPTASIIYSLTATGTNGCLGYATKTITVNPLPTLTVTGNNVLCAGNATTLTASGANTYTWSAGFLVPTIGVTPLSSTNYSVIGKDANNCTNTTTYSVTVNQLPTLNVTTTNTLLCTGETSTLSVLGATSYTWSDNSNGTDIIVTPTATTNYSVIGTDANGCNNSSVFTQSVSICTGIQQVNSQLNSVIVFPNPNNGEFTIQSQIGDVVNITNELGQVIEIIELNQQNNFSYHVNHLQNGIYFLVGKTVKQKVIVSK
jgi:N-acetylneuraminic acid mutarotase